jgi:tetratricopeptide (TPR) repeat protein
MKKLVIGLLLLVLFNLPVAAKDSSKALWNVFSSTQKFVGREKVLAQIRDHFQNKSPLLCLTGFAGFGKTLTAKRYCECSRDHYQVIWWIDGERDLQEQLKKFSEALTERFPHYVPSTSDFYKNSAKFVFRALEKLPASWLIVFDNMQTSEQIRDMCPQNRAGQAGHILVTSRSNIGWENNLPLPLLDGQESLALLQAILGKDDAELEKLVPLFQGYPLAIAQAASFIKSHPTMDVARYLQLVSHDKTRLRTREGSFVNQESNVIKMNGYEKAIYQAIDMSVKRLKEESPSGFELLKIMSFLWNKHVPLFLLEQYLKDHLCRDDCDEAVRALCKYSFVEYHKSSQRFTIHELIQDQVQAQLSDVEKKEIIESLIKTFLPYFQKPRSQIVDFLNQNPNILTHTQKIAGFAKERRLNSSDLLEIRLKELEFTLSGRRDYARGKTLMAELEPEIHKAPARFKAIFYTNKTNYYMWKADLSKAIEAGNLALASLDKKENLEDYLRLLVYLAYVYRNHGDLENAEKSLARIREAQPDFEKDSYIDSIVAYVEGGILYDQGHFSKARDRVRHCIDVSRKSNFSFKSYYHREILYFLTLNRLERYQEALTEIEDFEKRLATIDVSSDHEIYARLLLAKAQAYLALKDSDKALTCAELAENQL